MSDSVRGQEVLILDADAQVQQGVYSLLSSAGLIVSAFGDTAAARKEVADRFFSVVLVDIDTPAPGEGLSFLQHVKECSPATGTLVLCSRRSFEVAVRSFRAGAVDVVVKEPDQVEYLKRRVIETARDGVRVDAVRGLLRDMSQAHEEFLKRMMEAARRIVDFEERLSGRTDGSVSSSDSGAAVFGILVVDAGQELARHLEQNVPKEGFQVRWAGHGGEALDVVGGGGVHLALVMTELPDLPGSMVVKTIKQLSPETLVIQVTAPSPNAPGSAHVIETSRNIPLIAKMHDFSEILGHIGELREAYRAKWRERKYLRAFRAQNFDFLKRYAELKQRIAEVLGE